MHPMLPSSTPGKLKPLSVKLFQHAPFNVTTQNIAYHLEFRVSQL